MGKARTAVDDAADGAGEESPDDASDLSKDEIFDLLRNQRRRFVLYYLEATEGDAELGDLATHVAAWENEESLDAVTSDQRKRAYTTLQQSHLPKLDEAGIVDFDDDRGTIEATAVAADLSIYLEVVPGNEFAWHEYYLGLGAVCCALMVAVWAGVYPFSFVPPLIWGSVISVVVVCSALLHVVSQRRTGPGGDDLPAEVLEAE